MSLGAGGHSTAGPGTVPCEERKPKRQSREDSAEKAERREKKSRKDSAGRQKSSHLQYKRLHAPAYLFRKVVRY